MHRGGLNFIYNGEILAEVEINLEQIFAVVYRYDLLYKL